MAFEPAQITNRQISEPSMPAPVEPKSANPTLTASIRKSLASPEREFSLDVEFNAAPGFTILFGPSGSGKTTLLDCVAGLATPDSGRIEIGERLLFEANPRKNLSVAKRGVGYVLQDLALFPHLTVEQNAEYGLAHLRVPPASSASPKCCRSFTSTTFAGAAPPRSQAENASAWLWRDLS